MHLFHVGIFEDRFVVPNRRSEKVPPKKLRMEASPNAVPLITNLAIITAGRQIPEKRAILNLPWSNWVCGGVKRPIPGFRESSWEFERPKKREVLYYVPTRNTEKVAAVVVYRGQFCRPPEMAFFLFKRISGASTLNMPECWWQPTTCFNFHRKNGGFFTLFRVVVDFIRLLSQVACVIPDTKKDQKEALRGFHLNCGKIPAIHISPWFSESAVFWVRSVFSVSSIPVVFWGLFWGQKETQKKRR